MISKMSQPRFVVRTIRHGRIRLFGRDWEPGRHPCPAHFDGQRAVFGLYWGPPDTRIGRRSYDEYGMADFISLWGSEFVYRGGEDWPGPFCEDGVFKWEWWRPSEDS